MSLPSACWGELPAGRSPSCCWQCLFEFKAVSLFTDPTTDSMANSGLWFKLGGDPARRSSISRQQGRVSPDLSVHLSAARSHPDCKPYMGKLPEKCIRNDSGLWYIVFSNIYFNVLISVLFEEKYCNWPIFHRI